MVASSGSTGFGGLDNNTVTGKSEKGRPTSRKANGGGTGGTGVEDPLGGGPSNKASQNRRGPKNARERPQTAGLPF